MNIKIHFPSVLIGAVLLAVGLVTTAFVSPSTFQRVAVIFPVEVKGIPSAFSLAAISLINVPLALSF